MTHSFISISDTQQRYNSKESLPLLIIDSPKCQAVISLYGGQILEYKASGKPALLWLSPLAVFEQGKAIRGGIPICAPWFGPHKSKQPLSKQQADVSYPNHGFCRTSTWQHDSTQVNDKNEVIVSLLLSTTASTKLIYAHDCAINIIFKLGDTLSIEYGVTNTGDTEMEFEWALHSYLAIEHINTTTVDGLDGLPYIDSANNNAAATLNGKLAFEQQVDRYFVNGSAQQTIHTTVPITVSGQHCDSVITWNPGQSLANKMADISAQYYYQFVCVERGAIFENQWVIAPQQQQSATMTLSN